ncbi:hypothetical protein LWI28_029291 [Acer negundo]|uniref:Uncharacterized protein n=1 Tax=Acer negundo TaxID=4023 RepID=A0AAD5IC59_ACENE|nr:hypothetical protein LWI28_029291 [Acer negundo]
MSGAVGGVVVIVCVGVVSAIGIVRSCEAVVRCFSGVIPINFICSIGSKLAGADVIVGNDLFIGGNDLYETRGGAGIDFVELGFVTGKNVMNFAVKLCIRFCTSLHGRKAIYHC